MNRRNFLTLLGAAGAGGTFTAPPVAAQLIRLSGDLSEIAAPVWAAWKEGYLQPDGRVVDRLQQNASHSEGQGYGMLLATEFNDHDAFRRMFEWTEANLALRRDMLLAWRYLPDEAQPVPDRNNASDGDLFYAWALMRASRRFSERRYLHRAAEIAQALAEHCIMPAPNESLGLVMLPAVQGFVHDERVTINPSYLMPLAMRELAATTGVSALAQCARDGEALLRLLAGDGLVPDWLSITPNGLVPAEGFSENAGYEAIRVPLFLVWSGLGQHPAVEQMKRVYERTIRPGAPVPTVIEPVSGVVLEVSPDPGYRALAALVSCAGQGGEPGSDMPAFDPRQPYYPATLQLFSMIAVNEVFPQCVPI
ncbi:MAG: twin-arginine translocation signal domain-containing protein [Pararhodobacter sp.]|nr:twin-arginine translocation signal domain-containing protein [Pararhodobacter sp.]